MLNVSIIDDACIVDWLMLNVVDLASTSTS